MINNKDILKKIISKTIRLGILNQYNNIYKLRNDSLNKLHNMRITKYNDQYNYYNRIYKYNNNTLINNVNLDKIVKRWISLFLNSKNTLNLLKKEFSSNNNLLSIYSSEPIFLHTNDKLNIYIRILLPKTNINKRNNINGINIVFNNAMNKLLGKSNLRTLNMINILSKLYNKEVNIIPILIKDGGVSEFIISNRSVYSPYKYNLVINKLNKYIVPITNIISNNYINKNSLFNILYYNNINNINNNLVEYSNINDIMTILPNLKNRYITGYILNYAGKLPKADSSARTTHILSMVGTLHNSNKIHHTSYTVGNNGLSSTKATIAQY